MPEVEDRHPYFVSLLDEDLSSGNQSFLGVLVIEQLELGDSHVSQTLCGFISIPEPVESFESPGRDLRSVIEEIQFEVDFCAIHVAQADAARIVEFFVFAAHLFQDAQSGRVIPPHVMHV